MIGDLPDHMLVPLTLLTPTVGVDAYGAPATTGWTEATFRGRIEHKTRMTDGTVTDGRRADASEWVLMTNDAQVQAHDRVGDAFGRIFDVSGTPAPRSAVFGLGHYEATLTLVDG